MEQTALEWYAARIHDIEFKKSVGAISVIEYYEELTKSLEQAKEMEKQQIEEAYSNGRVDEQFKGTGASFYITKAEQYYNKTFNK